LDTKEFFSPRFHYTFGPHEPATLARSGADLVVICPDSDNELSDGTLLRVDQRAQGPGLFEGNPMAGPIQVENAQPGDVIGVEIQRIELDRATGQTGLAPGHGLLPVHLASRPGKDGPAPQIPRLLYRWSIDAQCGMAELINPIGDKPVRVKLDPFIGCIGVCPKWGQSISTLFAGTFGGNMDVPAIKPGATLYLPVYQPGGLLMMGDIHAAQGHGEIIGGAIETSGRIHVRIHLHKHWSIESPRVRDAHRLYAIASDGDLRTAIQHAYAGLLDWLGEDEFGLHRFDAFNLVSQTGGVLIGNLVTSPYSVAAYVPVDAL
jgi:acetamidase/formamidase